MASTPHAQELLARAHPPDIAGQHYQERVVKRPLYLRATSPTPSARALRRRALNERKEKSKKRNKNKPHPLSAAKKRTLGLLEIPKEQQKYAIYEPLHQLWSGYMREILGIEDAKKAHVTAAGCGQMLASADMHGALLTVTRSRCVSRVGLTGIVLRDTKFTFELVTKDNAVKTVPKEHSMFRFEVPLAVTENEQPVGTEVGAPKPLVFEIMGEQFQSRAPDRANKKFRMHYQPDI